MILQRDKSIQRLKLTSRAKIISSSLCTLFLKVGRVYYPRRQFSIVFEACHLTPCTLLLSLLDTIHISTSQCSCLFIRLFLNIWGQITGDAIKMGLSIFGGQLNSLESFSWISCSPHWRFNVALHLWEFSQSLDKSSPILLPGNGGSPIIGGVLRFFLHFIMEQLFYVTHRTNSIILTPGKKLLSSQADQFWSEKQLSTNEFSSFESFRVSMQALKKPMFDKLYSLNSNLDILFMSNDFKGFQASCFFKPLLKNRLLLSQLSQVISQAVSLMIQANIIKQMK